MSTRVFLIRHGATTLSAEDRFAGSTDVDLSDEGRRQAQALGERTATEKLAAVYSSPMRRTLATAALVGGPHRLTATAVDGFREIGHGVWEGLTRREVEERYPGDYASWEQDPFTYAPAEGESGLSVVARALPALRALVLAHPNQVIAVVSHKATIRLLLSITLGIDPRGYRDRLDQSPACLNVLDFKDPVRARLMLYNDTSHYASKPREPGAALSKWWG
jgi:probable phosphoglycerate mutase